ncbi:hypothetical protein E2C01_093555 [Portunus trituberculatus]|uniref:Uncharacterized protein n=1 Tax=Portunus trituberculatus TaxID=210409 RepID=A0A5B7JTU9_PORTR|nr:hypothetical protein [Portunus trituberculatus]
MLTVHAARTTAARGAVNPAAGVPDNTWKQQKMAIIPLWRRTGDGRRTPHVNFVPENFKRPVEGGAAALVGAASCASLYPAGRRHQPRAPFRTCRRQISVIALWTHVRRPSCGSLPPMDRLSVHGLTDRSTHSSPL